jgi:hypothetical protein
VHAHHYAGVWQLFVSPAAPNQQMAIGHHRVAAVLLRVETARTFTPGCCKKSGNDGIPLAPELA